MGNIFQSSFQTAILFQRQGYNVFPCVGGKEKNCKSPAVKGWQVYSCAEEEIIEYQKKHPTALWAIHCDQDFFVIDVDTYNPEFKKSQEAITLFYELKKRYKVYQKTQNGGYHFFFQGKFKNRTSLLPGIDVKSVGGYVILYQNPVTDVKIESKQEFFNILPKFEFALFPKTKTEVGKRNNTLFLSLIRASKEEYPRTKEIQIQIAQNSGLPQKEIENTVRSAEKARAAKEVHLNLTKRKLISSNNT